jgi:Uma2 family endonuclease
MQARDEPVITRHRLTVDQYYRMAEAGVLEPDARVELIEGEVIDKEPMRSKCYAMVVRLTRLFGAATRELASLAVQLPLRLGEYSEPEPDLAVLKPRSDDYVNALPTAADVLLVVEVSDTSLAYDMRTKAKLYASHGVPAYWVFDLSRSVLHAHTQPGADGYGSIVESKDLGVVPLPGLPGTTVDLSGLA